MPFIAVRRCMPAGTSYRARATTLRVSSNVSCFLGEEQLCEITNRTTWAAISAEGSVWKKIGANFYECT